MLIWMICFRSPNNNNSNNAWNVNNDGNVNNNNVNNTNNGIRSDLPRLRMNESRISCS